MLTVFTSGNKMWYDDKNMTDAFLYTFIVYIIKTSALFSKPVAFWAVLFKQADQKGKCVKILLFLKMRMKRWKCS